MLPKQELLFSSSAISEWVYHANVAKTYSENVIWSHLDPYSPDGSTYEYKQRRVPPTAAKHAKLN